MAKLLLPKAREVCEETCIDFGLWVGLVLSNATKYVHFQVLGVCILISENPFILQEEKMI